MASLKAALSIICLSLLALQTVCSHPLSYDDQAPSSAEEVPCASIDTYTESWFSAHTLPAFRSPLHTTALFYTRNMSVAALKYAAAQSPPLTTIWNVWPCGLYDHRPTPSNPLRCIHADAALRQRFYEAMSRAFALKARAAAAVMHAPADYDDPPLDGIWARVELPALKDATDVGLVAKLDSLAERWGVAWRREGVAAMGRVWKGRVEAGASWIADGVGGWLGWNDELKRKRGVARGESCMPLSEYKWFDNINW